MYILKIPPEKEKNDKWYQFHFITNTKAYVLAPAEKVGICKQHLL